MEVKEQKEKTILDIIKNHEHDTKEIINQIKTKEIEIKELYQKLLEKNDTNEDYNLRYLLFMKEYFNNEFKDILMKRQLFISEKNYNKYFKDEIPERKTAREKFLSFFEYLRKINLQENKDKFLLLDYLLTIAKNESIIKLKTKSEITWDNEELYLNHLYFFMINNILLILKKYNLIPEDYLNNEKDEKKGEKEEKKENKKEIEKEKESKLNLLNKDIYYNSPFFTFYMSNLKAFLLSIWNNFEKRFKDLKLEKIEDKLLFEDFIQFISTVTFNASYFVYHIDIWNESFVDLTEVEIKEIIDSFNELNEEMKIEYKYDDKLDKMEINNDLTGSQIIINGVKKYAFKSLFNNIISAGFNQTYFDDVKIKYLKPSFYDQDLFVNEKKDVWGDILFEILNSKIFKEIIKCLYGDKQQNNFFNDKDLVKNIIDKIRYISYKTNFFGDTNNNNNTLRIYEYGLYSDEAIYKSISLLIFYGDHIIINIHEFAGNINAKLHNFYCDTDEFLNLPKISSIESVETKFFGKIVYELTIKEALYVLNIDNYKKSQEEFKDGFEKCKKESIEDLLKSQNLLEFLTKLDIDINEIRKCKRNESYPLYNKEKAIGQNKCPSNVRRHPLTFYENLDYLEEFFSYARSNNIKDADLVYELFTFKDKKKKKD